MSWYRSAVFYLGTLLLSAAPAFAFQVNTYTTGSQVVTSVASDAAGNFIVAWEGDDAGGDDADVVARRYGVDGAPLGAAFRVNDQTAGAQRRGAVSAAPDGSFVIAWFDQSGASADTDGAILARRYDSLGAPAGTAFLVSTYTTNVQASPRIAHDASGNFTVVWISDGQDGDGTGVFGQRFDSAGTPLGAEFQVNTYTTSNQSPNQAPAIAMAPDGTATVAWYSAGQDDGDISIGGGGVYAQRYDSAGAALGTEFRVNTATAGAQGVFGVDVATDAAGNFVVTWNESEDTLVQLAPGGNIAAQRYDSGGTPLGGNFFVNTVLDGPQYLPALAMDASGKFLVAFQGEDFDGAGVLAQTFRADGTKIDEEFFVNIVATNDQGNAVATASPGGHIIIAWSENDGDASGVFARRFNTAIPSCPGLPQAGCNDAGRGSLRLKQSGGGQVVWKWADGAAFSEEELGDPEAGLTAFAFCVYRENGVTDLLVDATIPAEGICEGTPCWKARQAKAAFKYRDADPAADGITEMGLRSGPIGRGKLLIKGGGPSLGISLPVGPFNSVTVQLINGNGECWQSVYDTAKANTVNHFKAK